MFKYFVYSILINIVIFGLFYIFVMEPIHELSQMMAKNWCESLRMECNFK